jgi:predicted esterase
MLYRYSLSKKVFPLCILAASGARALSAAPVVDVNHQSRMIQISPPSGETVRVSMVLLHGLGDSADGWGGAAHELASRIPGLRVVLPTAPVKPVTLNNGYEMTSWYDIKGLDDRKNEDCKGLEDSRETVLKLLESEAEMYPDAKLILGGFSQGGAVSLYTGLQYSKEPALAGVLCMSGYLPDPKNWKISDAGRKVPIMMRHGDEDMVVALWMAEKSKTHIEQAGSQKVEWKTYPMGHTATMEEIDDVAEWIKKLV